MEIKDNLTFPQENSERVTDTKLRFDLILFKQLDRIAISNSQNMKSEFIMSVKSFEILLTPYFDKEFKTERKTIIKNYEGLVNSVEPNKRGDIDLKYTHEEAIKMWAALMELIKREGLLPGDRTQDKIV